MSLVSTYKRVHKYTQTLGILKFDLLISTRWRLGGICDANCYLKNVRMSMEIDILRILYNLSIKEYFDGFRYMLVPNHI